MPSSPVPPAIAALIRNAILRHEGGYVHDPADPGGETKYGISRRSYPHVNIQALTLEDAVTLYYRDWWQRRMRFLTLLPPSMAAKIFDIGINTGARQAVRLCQRALKTCGFPVHEDGLPGQQTLAALKAAPETLFLAAFRQECARFYKTLAARRPALNRFLKGWLKRASA
jgi:lysozyme family protein